MNFPTRPALIVAAAAVLVVGCTTHKEPEGNWQDPFFPPTHGVAPTRAILERGYAAGAAEDAMLYTAHFDGDVLNSLGEQKVQAMLIGRPQGTPLHVYLNLPGTSMSTTRPTTRPSPEVEALIQRRTANVERALIGLGLDASDFVVSTGPNPDALRPADAGVRALQPVGIPQSGTAAPGNTGLPTGMPR